MPGFDHGIQRGVGMVVEAVIVAALFVAFIETGLIPKIVFQLFTITSIVGLVFLIDKTRYWSFGYLGGWILGLGISLDALIQTEFLGFFDLLLFGATAIGAVYLRLKIHSG